MKHYRSFSIFLILITVLLVGVGRRPVQARPLAETSVSLQINSISGPDQEGNLQIKGVVIPKGLRPDPNANFSNYLDVYLEFMGPGGQWPIFYTFYSIGDSCNVIEERCATEEENRGINIQSANLLSLTLEYEDEGVPIDIDETVRIPEDVGELRVVARLRNTLHGNPWDATRFFWDHNGPVILGEIPLQPTGEFGMPADQDSGQVSQMTPTPGMADLTINGQVKLVQAIEGTNLVADREVGVYVRPVWDPGVPSQQPPVQVTLIVDGVELGSQTKTANTEFTFMIPKNRFNAGSHQVIIKAVHLGNEIADSDLTNNVFIETVTAYSSRPLRILYTRVIPCGAQAVSASQLNQLANQSVAYLRQVYPVSGVQRVPGSYLVLPGTDMRISVSVAVAKTLVQHNANRCIQLVNGVPQANVTCQEPQADLALGAVPRGYYGTDEGWLFGRGSSIWGSWYDSVSLGFGWVTAGGSIDRAAITVVDNFQNPAHEFGHHYNLEDEYTSSSVGQVIPAGIILKDGRLIDLSSQMVTYYNFMGNAGVGLGAQDYWVNADTWNHILAEITSNAAVSRLNKLDKPIQNPEMSLNSGLETRGTALLVAGSISQEWQGTIYSVDQVYQYEDFSNSDGPISLKTVDASGVFLDEIFFDTFPFAVGEDLPFLVSLPVSDLGRVVEVRLYQAQTLLASQSRSENPPSAALNGQPDFSAESLTLSWQAQDLDEDPLRASVYYSTDAGQTWQVIALDLSESSLTLDTAELPGGTVQFRVVVSDGFNETQIVSDPVEVEGHLPSVEVFAPWGVSFSPEAAVILLGNADDLEDGTLADEQLVWTDENNQVLATGGILHTNELSPGQHQITLTATDSSGGGAQANIGITIEASQSALLQSWSDGAQLLTDNLRYVFVGLLCMGSMMVLAVAVLILKGRRTRAY